MLNLRSKQLIGAGLLLLSGEVSATGELMQGWSLSDPKPEEYENPARRFKENSTKSQAHDYSRSEASYTIPDLKMVDMEGNSIDLRQLIDYGGPVMIQFIFATCSTICPVLSASFASAQAELDRLAGGVYRLISISIDPEQDTPEKLNSYAKRFKAGKNWFFLTGDRDNVASLLKAFDASYAGNNKMYHKSLTLMRSGTGANWLRIEGLLSKNDVVTEYKKLIDLPNQSEN